MDAIYRCWALPVRWRRAPLPARWGAAIGLTCLSVWLAAIPLRIWPRSDWQGFGGLVVPVCYSLFLIGLNVLFAMSGAVTIAGERERHTWDALLLTPMGVPGIVRTKLILRTIIVAGIAALSLPFWLAWAYQVLEVNSYGPLSNPDNSMRAPMMTARLAVFLAWLGVRTIGHALPFVAFGIAVSARCSRVRTALGTTLASVGAAGVLVWTCTAVAWGPIDGALHRALPSHSAAIAQGELIAETVLVWPVSANDYDHFSSGRLLSDNWGIDLTADAAWLMAIPWALYWQAVRGCRHADGRARIPGATRQGPRRRDHGRS